MVEADAVLAKSPAEIDFLAVDSRGKIEQAYFDVLHYAAGGMNLLEAGLNGFGEAVALDPNSRRRVVGHERAAGTLDALLQRAKLIFELRQLSAGFNHLDQNRLDLRAQLFRFPEREQFGFFVGHLDCFPSKNGVRSAWRSISLRWRPLYAMEARNRAH